MGAASEQDRSVGSLWLGTYQHLTFDLDIILTSSRVSNSCSGQDWQQNRCRAIGKDCRGQSERWDVRSHSIDVCQLVQIYEIGPSVSNLSAEMHNLMRRKTTDEPDSC